MSQRPKLSTTIAKENYAYLESLVKSKKAKNLAEALDMGLARLRSMESRARLERDTAAYFANLPAKAAGEEARIEAALDVSADEVDFDEAPDA